MRKSLLFFTLSLLMTGAIQAQVLYLDHYDNNDPGYLNEPMGYTFEESGTEWTITGDGTASAWTSIVYILHTVDGDPVTVDVSGGKAKLYVKVKSSIGNTKLRIDMEDVDGYVSTTASLEKTLTTEYQVYEFDFTGKLSDAGYGGTPCDEGPCPLDSSQITQLQFLINAASGEFDGTVTIDFVAIGNNPASSIKETASIGTVALYPNPSGEKVWIDYNITKSADVVIQVHDIFGKNITTIAQGEKGIGKFNAALDVSGYAKGIYLVSFKENNRTVRTEKLIVR